MNTHGAPRAEHIPEKSPVASRATPSISANSHGGADQSWPLMFNKYALNERDSQTEY